MKNILFIIALLLSFKSIQAQTAVGSGFSYQGELLDNGSPANGDYDMTFIAFETELATLPLATVFTFSNPVTNGLFNISNIDFETNDEIYFGDEIWIEIQIKKSSDTGILETLTSRQRINSVPYSVQAETAGFAYTANTLAAGFANNREVLTFDGTAWRALATAWQETPNLVYTRNIQPGSQISIGTATPNAGTKFTVNTFTNGIISQFIGNANVYNEFMEAGVAKGYIGSFQDGSHSGTTSDDFEIGTSGSNATGKVHLTINAIPKVTVSDNGNVGIINTTPIGKFQVDTDALVVTSGDFVGIGTIIPDAQLEVNAAANVNKTFSATNDTIEKFTVHQNGGSSVGTGFVPPTDGLFVEGDVKQQHDSNGLMKYMARVRCLGASSSLTSFYNGTNNNGSVSVTAINTTGRCQVNFPSNINTRYWQISAVSVNGNHNVNCHTLVSNSQLICQRTLSGANNDGDIMILVY